jgi:hypothetical protein
MSIPEVTNTIGGYNYNWKEDQIKIDVSRIKTSSDGSVKGEIKIVSYRSGKSCHIHQAQMNFVASLTRKTLAKTLEERLPGLDWYSILEQLSVMTLDRCRGGEPLIELLSGEDVKPPEYLLQPIIIRNYPTVLFGDPGSAKSTLAIILSQLLMMPWTDNPLGFEVTDEPIKILYLDWETDETTIQWQLTCLQRGMNLNPLKLSYRRCALPLSQDIDQIKKYIDESHAEAIIIDSLGLACGGELKDAAPAISFFGALRQLHTTSIILAHTAKGNGDGNNTRSIYGSVFFEAQARSVWQVTKEINGTSIEVSLNHMKSPPFQKKQNPLGININYDPNGYMTLGLCEAEDSSVNAYIEKMETQNRILDCLKDGVTLVKDIALKLNISENNCRNKLSILKKKQLVIKVGQGYGLVTRQFKEDGPDDPPF